MTVAIHSVRTRNNMQLSSNDYMQLACLGDFILGRSCLLTVRSFLLTLVFVAYGYLVLFTYG